MKKVLTGMAAAAALFAGMDMVMAKGGMVACSTVSTCRQISTAYSSNGVQKVKSSGSPCGFNDTANATCGPSASTSDDSE